VGVKAMDNQHITLVSILNELHAAMMKGEAQSVADRLLKKLMEYAGNHFSAEEKLMASVQFPGLAAHREQHRQLTIKAEKIVARYQQGDNTIFTPLLYFLRDWLTTHMQQEDKEYTAWLNAHGVC
jgi:hemerythrin-like metal-binding protein